MIERSEPKKRYNFETPDREGFEYLLSPELMFYRDMLFLKSSGCNQKEIDKILKDLGSAGTQRFFNHVHLMLYAYDYNLQRQWADELERAWRKRIESEYPEWVIITERKDDGYDIEVTFRIARKPE